MITTSPDERARSGNRAPASMASFEAFWPNKAKKTNDYNAAPDIDMK
jgi:hypothetical protein